MCRLNTPVSIQSSRHFGARTSCTHCHICPTKYSFTPEWSEARECEVSCPRTQYRTNVQRWEGINMIFLWKLVPNQDWTHTTGSRNYKALRSNHCVNSVMVYHIIGFTCSSDPALSLHTCYLWFLQAQAQSSRTRSFKVDRRIFTGKSIRAEVTGDSATSQYTSIIATPAMAHPSRRRYNTGPALPALARYCTGVWSSTSPAGQIQRSRLCQRGWRATSGKGRPQQNYCRCWHIYCGHYALSADGYDTFQGSRTAYPSRSPLFMCDYCGRPRWPIRFGFASGGGGAVWIRLFQTGLLAMCSQLSRYPPNLKSPLRSRLKTEQLKFLIAAERQNVKWMRHMQAKNWILNIKLDIEQNISSQWHIQGGSRGSCRPLFKN